MQVSVETTSGLERRMTVEVPEERIEREVEQRLRRMMPTTKLKGFRPGKVPYKVVKQQYGGQVRQEVLGEVMESTFFEAVAQEKLHPAGMPQIEPKVIEPGKSLEYTATFEVIPEVELSSLDGIAIDKTVAEVSDADVDKMLETLRSQHTVWKEAERAAADGDRVTIDFRGTIDGEAFEGGEAKEALVTIGGKRMIEGFEEGLIGAKAGDELTLDVTFPEDYPHEPLAGKPAQFAIKVHKVEAPEVPELDDEFAKQFGLADGSLETLRQEVRQNMQRELDNQMRAKVKQQVMDKLLELNEFEVPKALIEAESRTLMEHMRQNMHVPQGKNGVDLDPSIFEDQAKRRVSLGLILSKLVHSNELKAEPEKVKAEVEKIAATYEKPEEVIKWYYADQKRLGEVESLVLEDSVVEFVLGQAKVNEVKASFDEIMNRNEGEQA